MEALVIIQAVGAYGERQYQRPHYYGSISNYSSGRRIR